MKWIIYVLGLCILLSCVNAEYLTVINGILYDNSSTPVAGASVVALCNGATKYSNTAGDGHIYLFFGQNSTGCMPSSRVNLSATSGSLTANRSSFASEYFTMVLGTNYVTNNTLSLSLYDNVSGIINSFNISMTNLNTSTTLTSNTINGVILASLIANNTYNITLESANYPLYKIVYVATDSGVQYINYSIRQAFINVSIYQEGTNSLITQYTQLFFIDLTNSTINTSLTTSGLINYQYLNLHPYELRIASQNYSTRTYNIVFNNSVLDYFLSAYLIPVNSSNTTFTFYDVNGAIITNLHVYSYALTNTSYVLVEDHYSDITGKATFSYVANTYYRFCPVATGFSTDCFNLDPITQATYDILIATISSSPSYVNYNVSGSSSYSNITDILTFSYLSYIPQITNYSYTVSKLVNGKYIVICSNSSQVQSNSFNCNLYGYSGMMYVQGVANNEQIFYDAFYDIKGLPSLFDNLNQQDAAYIVAFLLAIIIFAGVGFGLVGTLVMGVFGTMIMYWLHILTPISETVLVLDVIVCTIIYIGIKGR